MDRLIEYCNHHPWLAAYVLIAGIALLVYELRQRAHSVGGLAPQDAIRLMNQGAAVIDLRVQQDYQAGHINGARNIAAAEIGGAADTLKRYREKPVIVYCERGSAAPGVVRALAQQGFTKVFNLRGGIAAWRAENLPLARD